MNEHISAYTLGVGLRGTLSPFFFFFFFFLLLLLLFLFFRDLYSDACYTYS
jgi:hypothetical protein